VRHLTIEQLIDFVAEPERLGDRQAVDEHLRACDECPRLLERVKAIDAALAAPETWTIVDDLRDSEDFERAECVLDPTREEFAQLMAREDADAAELLRDLAEAPGEFVWANVSADARFHTTGVVRLLCKTAKSLCERKPLIARTVAEQAILISEAIPASNYPAPVLNEIRGTAWKDLANAQRCLGAYSEAVESLERADRAFRRLPAPELHLAIVRLVRAIVEMKRECLEEAELLARRSAATFTSLGQTARYLDAALVIGAVLAKRGNYQRSREVNLELLSHATAINDLVLEARVSQNLGYVALELGEIDEAATRYQQALQLYQSLDATIEVIRVRWSLALIVLARGRLEEGITRLRAVMDDFLDEGVLMAAAMVALDMAKPLLASGAVRRRRAVIQSCARLTREFRAAGMRTSAMTALAYFRSAVRQEQADPAAVEVMRQHVRTFLDQLQDQPHLPFEPPRTR
jgi:tetratricopeptide (TPR) repeat protein